MLSLLKTMDWRKSVSVLRTAIVLTDGESNMNEGTLINVAKEVHNLKPPVTVFAVSVGNNYSQEELDIIATNPDS